MRDVLLSLRDALFPGEWEVVVLDGATHFGSTPGHTTRAVSTIRHRLGHYYADPFLVADGQRLTVVCEEFDYFAGRGRIVAFDVDLRAGAAGARRVILDDGRHLSFPFVFRCSQGVFLVPESASSRDIRAFEFEGHAVGREFTLLGDVDAVDSTLLEDGPCIYLFTSLPGGGGIDGRGAVQVFVTEAASFPHGKWSAVPVVGPTLGRNAGSPFRRNGRLYRPTQISRRSYGEGIAVAQVCTLSPERYQERWAWDLVARRFEGTHLHTVNEGAGISVIDRRRLSLERILRKQFGRFAMLAGRLHRALLPDGSRHWRQACAVPPRGWFGRSVVAAGADARSQAGASGCAETASGPSEGARRLVAEPVPGGIDRSTNA